jgi:membrane-bound metal-dependent hydrolase YbcI (DUF457 family)
VHRGIWHSISAGIVCALAAAIILYYALGRPDGVAWLGAGFLFIGYLTHLTLDEIYSVDVMGAHIKKSFGTALKLVDVRHPSASSAMVVAGALLLFIVPSTHTFVEGISSRSLWAGLQQRLMPEDYWFGVFAERGRLAAVPADGSEQATGSLPAPAATETGEQPAP